MFDPFEDESDEFEPADPYEDPEEAFEDPDDDSLTIPRVESTEPDSEADEEPYTDSIRIPEVTTDETEAPDDLLEAFWVLIVVVNAALLALSLGALFLLFNGDVATGGWLLVAGFVLSGFAARRYWLYQHTAFESTGTTEADETNTTVEDQNPNETTTTAETVDTGTTDATDRSHP